MPDTLLLDTINWDLLVDLNGNIAMAQEPYSLAQDVASQCRLFEGELWFDTTQGVPYFPPGGTTPALPPGVTTNILGEYVPQGLLQQIYQENALLVPNVATALILATPISPTDRSVTGQIVITATDGPSFAITLAGELFGNPTIAAVASIQLANLSGYPSG
jgi:hypothetical protein